MRKRQNQQISRQRGITLIEAMMSLAITSAMIAGASEIVNRYTEDTRTTVAGQHMSAFGQAALDYLEDNAPTLTPGTYYLTAGTPPSGAGVSWKSIATYLPANFSATNAFGQTLCVRANVLAGGAIEAMVIADPTNAAGAVVNERLLDDVTLAHMAGIVGASGGGVYASVPGTNTNTIYGVNGGWTAPVANFRGRNCNNVAVGGNLPLPAGTPMMALWVENDAIAAPYIYRDAIPGRPELNRMNTRLDMGGNTVGSLLVATEDGPCSSTSDIATSASGLVLSCQGGQWRSQNRFWRDPVANTFALPLCSGSNHGETRVVMTAADGANPRAYTCHGTTWRPLALDNNGDLTLRNLNASGSVNARNVNATLGVTANSVTANSGTISTLNSSTINSSTVNASSQVNTYNVNASGRVTAGTMQVTALAAEGGGCSPIGLIARDPSGMLLSCQSWQWKKAQGGGLFGGAFEHWQDGTCYPNPVTNACSCPSGYIARRVGRLYNITDLWGRGYVCVQS